MTNPSPQGGETPRTQLRTLRTVDEFRGKDLKYCDGPTVRDWLCKEIEGNFVLDLKESQAALTRASQENEELKRRAGELEGSLHSIATACENCTSRGDLQGIAQGTLKLEKSGCAPCEWDQRNNEVIRLRALLVEAQGAFEKVSEWGRRWLKGTIYPATRQDMCDTELDAAHDVCCDLLTRLNAELGEGRTQ